MLVAYSFRQQVHYQVASEFKDVDKGYSGVLDRIFEADNSFVEIGWFEGEESKNQRRDTEEGSPNNPKNVDLAIFNEFGTRRNGKEHIPARPFMRTSHDENIEKTNALIKREYGRIIDGTADAKTSLGKIGLFVQAYTQRKITTLRTPKNADSTVIKKTVAGKVGDNPLIDTAQMRNSISTRVVIKK